MQDEKLLLAKAWDVVVCPNKHPCLLVLKEVRVGDPITEKAFRTLGKMKLERGQRLSATNCPECGECLFTVGKIFKLQKRET
jgi:hypothetical protein